MLWPLLGWLDFSAARWFWALISAFALGWLVMRTIAECEPDGGLERIFVGLLPLRRTLHLNIPMQSARSPHPNTLNTLDCSQKQKATGVLSC